MNKIGKISTGVILASLLSSGVYFVKNTTVEEFNNILENVKISTKEENTNIKESYTRVEDRIPRKTKTIEVKTSEYVLKSQEEIDELGIYCEPSAFTGGYSDKCLREIIVITDKEIYID